LIGAVAAIALLSLVMVYSSTHQRVDGDAYYFVKRQALFIALGMAVMVSVVLVDYRKLRDFSLLAYVAVVTVLLAVLSPLGSSARGSQAWFQLPSNFQLQPSELAKFGLIVALAGYIAAHRGELDARRVLLTMALAAAPLALVLQQPDLGTTMVLAMIAFGIFAVGGVSGRHLAVLALLACTGIYLVVSFGMLEDYQVDRLTAVVDPGADDAAAFNQEQSKIAIGTGRATGAGFLDGPQTQGGFVPEQHTDFIFTAVGEELGFGGAAGLLALLAVVMWRIWRTATIARDFFGMLVCVGVMAMFGFQIFENVGMTMGIMPVTGIPLPFLSYGGSATITAFACVGLVLNVALRRFE